MDAIDAIIALLMFTFGIGVHVIVWSIILEFVTRYPKTENTAGGAVLCVAVLLIGSFLILTSIIIVVKMSLIGAVLS